MFGFGVGGTFAGGGNDGAFTFGAGGLPNSEGGGLTGAFGR